MVRQASARHLRVGLSRMNGLTPRELASTNAPLRRDLTPAEIDARFAAHLKAIRASGHHQLDPDARKSADPCPVRLGVSAHQGAFQ
jgi:hypothetical protein